MAGPAIYKMDPAQEGRLLKRLGDIVTAVDRVAIALRDSKKSIEEFNERLNELENVIGEHIDGPT